MATTVSYRSSNLDVEFDLDCDVQPAGTDTFTDHRRRSDVRARIEGHARPTRRRWASVGFHRQPRRQHQRLPQRALASGGAASLNSNNLVTAQKIIDKAIKQVSQLRGRLGAFQKFTIGSTINSLGVAFENAQRPKRAIRDTDFAEETANLTRSQILAQAATTVLAQANATPQAALTLLRG